MDRRDFILFSGGLGAALMAPRLGFAQQRYSYQNLLILVELKGGNDGLNTVVPYTNPLYYNLRPHLALKRDEVLQLDQALGLHPSLEPLMEVWRNNELAIVQGLGYPKPNLSHFRSIEIWETASKADQYLHQGWLTRAFQWRPTPKNFSADGVVIGSQDLGPLDGGSRAIALNNTEQFLSSARLASPSALSGNPTLGHILKVEADIVKAADGLKPQQQIEFKTQFPQGAFGEVVKSAAHVVANGEQTGKYVAALRLTLNGFDTHQNQTGTHTNLLRQLAEGLNALRSALKELNRWDSSLIMTYAEFGRRPKENLSNGTDHGTAAPHFVMGGRVKGGLLGTSPDLARLDTGGNLQFTTDFRSLYATALYKWWGVDPVEILGENFTRLDLIRT